MSFDTRLISPVAYIWGFADSGDIPDTDMSKRSKEIRKRAAEELRNSRNGASKASKAENVKRAAAYKQLAENEEWLEGEKPRTQQPTPKAKQ